MPKVIVSLRSIFYKRCKSYFWLSIDENEDE